VSIAALPLGLVSTSDSSTHAGFQSMLNGIDRIGVSSSSGLVLSSLFGTSPFSTCRESCDAVRVSSFHLWIRYIVLWRRILWLSIVVTSSGVDVVCWGEAVGRVTWSIDLFDEGRGLDGGAVSVR
jgi:hypothetical protein